MARRTHLRAVSSPRKRKRRKNITSSDEISYDNIFPPYDWHIDPSLVAHLPHLPHREIPLMFGKLISLFGTSVHVRLFGGTIISLCYDLLWLILPTRMHTYGAREIHLIISKSVNGKYISNLCRGIVHMSNRNIRCITKRTAGSIRQV